MEPDRWGEKNRTHHCLTHLQRYYLSRLDQAIIAIESSTATPTLVGFAGFKTTPPK